MIDYRQPHGRRMRNAVMARVGALVLAALMLTACRPVPAPPRPEPTTAACEEDQPCWNCHVDGNRQCGPGDPAVKA